jgi:hypothetical protein
MVWRFKADGASGAILQYHNLKFDMYFKKEIRTEQMYDLRRYAPVQEIVTEIVFGTPSKNCEGVGICRMLGPNYIGDRQILCPHAPAYLGLDVVRNVMTVRFPKIHITRQMVARHFYKRLFKVTESYRVPARFTRAFGIRQMLTIHEGIYAVKETREDWILVFDLRGVP